MLLFTVQRSFLSASYRLSSWILLTLQGKCKANANASSLGLCWAAAFTRTRNFLFASTKVLNILRSCKFFNRLIILIWTYMKLNELIWTYTKYFELIICISHGKVVSLYHNKFKTLLLEDPDLSGFATQRRRTLLPCEVNIIYQHLGHP